MQGWTGQGLATENMTADDAVGELEAIAQGVGSYKYQDKDLRLSHGVAATQSGHQGLG